jgi:hypothetical protein
MLGVVLARLAGMVRRVRGVAMRGMRVVGGLFVAVGFVMLGRFAMMTSRMLVMVGGGLMVLDDLFLRHGALRLVRLTGNRCDALTLGMRRCRRVTAACAPIGPR